MNPLLFMMNKNKLQNVLNSGNPMDMAMSMLKQQNPQMFQHINSMMNSGMNPQQAMKQLGIDSQQFQNMISNFSRQK